MKYKNPEHPFIDNVKNKTCAKFQQENIKNIYFSDK